MLPAIPARPLPALLSQILVAFTVELDNAFQREMTEEGYPGTGLSLSVWAGLMQFLNPDGTTVRDLAGKALVLETSIRLELGCLERWQYILLQPGKRDGWGSGRGIRGDWVVQLTSRGSAACRVWPRLLKTIEFRWEKRFGRKEFFELRQALETAADRLDLELPDSLPCGPHVCQRCPSRAGGSSAGLPLPTLLSRLLLAFRIEFDRESPVPLELCANTLRVLSEEPVRESEIPILTGASPETSGIGWQIKPFVIVEQDPSGSRGKVVRLSAKGRIVRRMYEPLIATIERRWEESFGAETIATLRESLRMLFDRKTEDGPLIAKGLIPEPGTIRAGNLTPALGRSDIGAAAQKRMRDLVRQTEAFIRNPAGSLPHYPLWDMNRGFGP